MPLNADKNKSPLLDRKTELQRKIQVLEGDRTAYYEISQSTIRKNQETIRHLRQENKRLYKKVSEANASDEHIIREAFHNRSLEKGAFRNMSGKAALITVDQKVLSKVKRLNALKHTTQTYQQKLNELKMEFQRLKPEGSGAASADARALKKEEDAMKLRTLENRLEKTQFKCKEAENIMTFYLKLKRQLQDESLTFQGQLDSLEAEILKHREELHNLQVMNNDAQLSKEAAKVICTFTLLVIQEEEEGKEGVRGFNSPTRETPQCGQNSCGPISPNEETPSENHGVLLKKHQCGDSWDSWEDINNQAELQQQEELLSKERKEREHIISSYRKKVEEHKAQAEKADRKVQRTTTQPDELSSEAQRSNTGITAEEEKAISTFEEAFRRLKEAAGVTDIQEIVDRFISQNEMHQHLEKLKRENEETLQQLKEQRELLSQQFEEIKYSGESKLSSEQQILEERGHHLEAQQQRCDAAKELLDRLIKTLSTVRAGAEHLAEKLQHITLSEDRVPTVCPDSEELVLELLTQCELKLQVLQKEFEGKDLTGIMKEMEEEEFHVRIEGKLPEYNTRVKLLEDPTLELFDDEEKNDEDQGGIISREALKRQSQLIIDSNSKKKPWKKKKGKF